MVISNTIRNNVENKEYLINKAKEMSNRINAAYDIFRDGLSDKAKVNYLVSILGFEKVSCFTRKGYKTPDNCLLIRTTSNYLDDIFVRISNDN